MSAPASSTVKKQLDLSVEEEGATVVAERKRKEMPDGGATSPPPSKKARKKKTQSALDQAFVRQFLREFEAHKEELLSPDEQRVDDASEAIRVWWTTQLDRDRLRALTGLSALTEDPELFRGGSDFPLSEVICQLGDHAADVLRQFVLAPVVLTNDQAFARDFIRDLARFRDASFAAEDAEKRHAALDTLIEWWNSLDFERLCAVSRLRGLHAFPVNERLNRATLIVAPDVCVFGELVADALRAIVLGRSADWDE